MRVFDLIIAQFSIECQVRLLVRNGNNIFSRCYADILFWIYYYVGSIMCIYIVDR